MMAPLRGPIDAPGGHADVTVRLTTGAAPIFFLTRMALWVDAQAPCRCRRAAPVWRCQRGAVLFGQSSRC